VPSRVLGFVAGLVRVVATRPRLWATAFRQWKALCPRGWWATWPPLPAPDRAYLAFRMEAMYGSGSERPSASEVLAYLEWCHRMEELAR